MSLNEPEAVSQQRLWDTLRRTVSEAGESTGATALETMRTTVGKAQRKLGEDYYAVLAENPLISDTLSRSDLLVQDRELLSTVFNIPWTTTLLWSAAAGSSVTLQRPIGSTVGKLFHYGPGHVKRWDEINKFMDTAAGRGHRLRFGHSLDYLRQIVERYGIEGVPAYFTHLLQDFTTVDGIPIVPNAWDWKQTLQSAGLPRKAAVGLVSISFSSLLAALAVVNLLSELWKFFEAFRKAMKTRNYLNTAAAAIRNRDYIAAVTNYQRALEVERSPFVLMALGQVYMQRASNRLRAHQSFTEAVTLLASSPGLTVPYGHAGLSVRGLAGIQALATADVLADIHPEHWNDHVRDLVNASVFSFSSAAARQARQSDDLIPNAVIPPSQFSAAINYYLAAKSACYYPFAEERQETVQSNVMSALRSLGLMAQYDEDSLRQPANTIRQLWTMELLPPEETEAILATH